MAKHKLILDDVFEEVSFTLIAIHCSLEDYRLAYLLNKDLGINLKRDKEDLDYDNVSASYSIFGWNDLKHHTQWNLISNVCRIESETAIVTESLFSRKETVLKTHNLIAEHKNVDYFLKISTDGLFSNEKAVLRNIQEIPNVVTAYAIDTTKLKSRNNLIFN